MSAGQLHHLKTVQDTDGNFFVVNSVGDVISKGYFGKDNLFYLLDKNLLQTPDDVMPSHRLKIELVPGRRLRNAATYIPKRKRMIRRQKVNIITRRGNGIDLKGVKRSDTPTIQVKSRKQPAHTQSISKSVSFNSVEESNTNSSDDDIKGQSDKEDIVPNSEEEMMEIDNDLSKHDMNEQFKEETDSGGVENNTRGNLWP